MIGDSHKRAALWDGPYEAACELRPATCDLRPANLGFPQAINNEMRN